MSELTTRVDAVLKHKGSQVWSTKPHASVYESIEIMADKQVGALLVMDQGQLLGILSERDYARKVIITDNRIRHLPVLENGAVVGMISIGDLINWVITEQQKTIQHLEAYISGVAG